jgi:DNA invertase Pin-like site-specific DNA recombinase
MAELSKHSQTHLRREAWVYVRQSTMVQVRENTESLARQYALSERAVALGFAAENVRVVDEDLGRSGADATARSGFQSLVAAVGLGKVGIVLGVEVSRLARRNADWYQLLDLCAMTDTLIGDADGLYHPGDYNDRLVLGLKGTMSEAELHLLRGRLNAGLRHKAARGALRQTLPVGFDYDEDDRVTMSPDEAVRAALVEVFSRFATLGTGRQVLVSLLEDGIAIPRRTNGSRHVRWEKATYPAVHDLLTNPAYAGAYVFGRTKTRRSIGEGGRVRTFVVEVPVADWEVCIPEHHPGYITFETYLANRDRLRSNWRAPAGEGGGPAREGAALLQGLVRCGRCGRRMQVGYSARTEVRYLCNRAMALYGSARTCQSIAGRRLEAAVLAEVFAMLEPAALTATVTALSEAEAINAKELSVFELGVERARFEAGRARRQFDACEPENRLVARSLEQAWEERLVGLRQAEADLAARRARRPVRLSEEELAWLGRAGADLRAVFDAPSTTTRDRKQLLRALITDVVITVEAPKALAHGHIAWEGGAVTPIQVTLARRGAGQATLTPPAVVELVRRLAPDHDDASIAAHLNRHGHLTATGLAFKARGVRHIRLTRGIPGPMPEAKACEPADRCWMSVTEAQAALGVSRATVSRWLVDGFVTGRQDEAGRWSVRVDDELRGRVIGELPAGWARLDQAARALGVARQTVLDRIRRGELEAVHVQQGRRSALAVRLPDIGVGLFASAQ